MRSLLLAGVLCVAVGCAAVKDQGGLVGNGRIDVLDTFMQGVAALSGTSANNPDFCNKVRELQAIGAMLPETEKTVVARSLLSKLCPDTETPADTVTVPVIVHEAVVVELTNGTFLTEADIATIYVKKQRSYTLPKLEDENVPYSPEEFRRRVTGKLAETNAPTPGDPVPVGDLGAAISNLFNEATQ